MAGRDPSVGVSRVGAGDLRGSWSIETFVEELANEVVQNASEPGVEPGLTVTEARQHDQPARRPQTVVQRVRLAHRDVAIPQPVHDCHGRGRDDGGDLDGRQRHGLERGGPCATSGEQTPPALTSHDAAEKSGARQVRNGAEGRTADGHHGIDLASQADMAQRGERPHGRTDSHHGRVRRPGQGDDRLEVFDLAVTEGGPAATRPVAPEVCGVDREPTVEEISSEVDYFGVALRTAEAVSEHDGHVGVRGPVHQYAQRHAVARGQRQRRCSDRPAHTTPRSRTTLVHG